MALASDVPSMIAWRFLQGLLLPPIFAVIGRLYRRRVAGEAGRRHRRHLCRRRQHRRFLPDVSCPACSAIWSAGAAAFWSWRDQSLAGAIIVALLLPREKQLRSLRRACGLDLQMLRHLRDPQLLATYAIGSGVLFNFIAIFTYVELPPRRHRPITSPTPALGRLFASYLVGTVASPMAGRAIAQFGRRRLHVRR